jgi:proteic killer suppression protein
LYNMAWRHSRRASLVQPLNGYVMTILRCNFEGRPQSLTYRFFEAVHAPRLRLQLAALNRAKVPTDLGAPGWKLHSLKGNLSGHWAITVNGNWRITFRFENGDALLVDYQDYH